MEGNSLVATTLEIARIWKEYRLEERTRFNTRVTKVKRVQRKEAGKAHAPSLWYINDDQDGPFDAIITAVGTCGEPKWLTGSPLGTARQHPDTYRGPVLHSSQLDHATPELVQDKTVVVIGSGASAIEAVETAFCRGARLCILLARKDKWIIPRNVIIDTLIAAQPFGRDMPLRCVTDFLWERFLQCWHYYGVPALVPTVPLFGGTPIVNDKFLDDVRSGKCVYVRGDTMRLTQNGVLVNTQPHNAPHLEEIKADLIVLATGYKRPDIDFLPCELFPEGYEASDALLVPNLYLQNFSTEDWSVLMTNSAYENAIASAGHFHIGIYTRTLITFILDPVTAPTAKDMKLWVDAIRYLKRGASGGALGFFMYMELIIWLLLFYIIRPDRLRWMPFILAGWGLRP
ncbi:hypothetical protein PAXINDRAFT_91180, partial [Paxillus involutus ATCC 200175]